MNNEIKELSKTQRNAILSAMLKNEDKNKKWWGGADFQAGKYFIGYSASARISELMNIYPTLFNVTRVGKYRYVSINWENAELINELKEMLGVEK